MANVVYQRREVEKGDTLSEMAEKFLGAASRWNEIYEANRDVIKNPNQIQPGQNLKIPGSANSEDLFGPQPEKPPDYGQLFADTREPWEASSRGLFDEKPLGLLTSKQPMGSYKVDKLPAGSDFMEGMLRRGWTVEEAAGAAGNAHVESGFRPGIKSSVKNENSYGLLQWNSERLEGLKKMAAERGMDWMDPETQMDWIHMERTGDSVKYGGSDEREMYRRALEPGGTAEEIAQRFGQFVERPKRLADTVEIRRAAAGKYAYIDDITDRLIGG